MRIAILSGTPAVPVADGTCSQLYNLMRVLRAEGHDVWFIYLPTWPFEKVDGLGHDAELGDGRFIALDGEGTAGRAPMVFRIRRKLAKLIGSEQRFYNSLDEFFHPLWLEQLQTLQRKYGFETVFVSYIFHSRALEAFPADVRKLLNTHDCFADRHRVFAQSPNPYGYWFSVPRKVEEGAFRRADVVIAVQAAEAQNFAERLNGPHPKVTVISPMVDLSQRVHDYSAENLLFLGARSDANIISLGWFITEIWPLILAACPATRLFLAGTICNSVADAPNVEKLGRVDRLCDAFRRAPIMINPIKIGTGISVKLLDAMASGVVGVSTATGARGLGQNEMSAVRVVSDDDAHGFSREVVALLSSEAKRREFGDAAFAAAERWNEVQIANLRRLFQ